MKRLLRVLDSTGDTRIPYDVEDPTSLASARAAFDAAVQKGASAFNVAPGTNDSTKRISSFDESSEETILVPKITGG